jgi:DNA modification methylase
MPCVGDGTSGETVGMSFEKVELDCGNIVLYRGDCLEVMASWPDGFKVDAVVTDPPYAPAETHDSHLSSITLRSGEAAGRPLGFGGISEQECVELTRKLVSLSAGWCVFTCEWHYMEALHKAGLLVRFGIWRKRNGAPQFTGDRPGMGWEAVAICHRPGRKRWNGGGKHAFWDIPKIDGSHPTQKPLPLFEAFVEDFSDAGGTVFDPFMGSGTSGVASVKLGRKYIGIELDGEHFDAASARIQKELDQRDGTGPLMKAAALLE